MANKYGLNDEQWNAINSPSPVYLHASAGAGKTKSLVAKIQLLLDSGKVDPESILAVTFTNKAAKEMKGRLQKRADLTKMQISTMHSMSVRIIRKYLYYTHLKYPFSIYDEGDQMSVIKTIMKAKDMTEDAYAYKSTISTLKSEGILPDQIKTPILNGMGLPLDKFLTIYEQYQAILKQNNACDFDDLLILAHDCLQHADCKKYYSDLWKHILVDEVQDTSKLQYKIITSIYDPEKTLTMYLIGDKNQGVYSWRGAFPENIDAFIKTYNANVKYLTYNYRSCSEIIAHANNFQQFGKPMVPKSATAGKVSTAIFASLEAEADQIADAILRGGNYNNTAVIYRMNSRSLYFEQMFAKRRIPYKVVNELPFYQRRVCKDLMAALTAANNPDDRSSLARIINNPKRGFGDVKKVKLLEQGRAYLEDNIEDLPLVKPLLKLLSDIKGMETSRALTEYLNRSGYWQTVDKDSDRNMIQALQNVVVAFPTVEELVLASTFLERDSNEGVNLITAHGAKGLEYDRVFLVGLEEGVWPHKNAEDLAEERRLFYVGVTRAKRALNISYSKSRTFKGKALAITPSPLFLESYKQING